MIFYKDYCFSALYLQSALWGFGVLGSEEAAGHLGKRLGVCRADADDLIPGVGLGVGVELGVRF